MKINRIDTINSNHRQQSFKSIRILINPNQTKLAAQIREHPGVRRELARRLADLDGEMDFIFSLPDNTVIGLSGKHESRFKEIMHKNLPLPLGVIIETKLINNKAFLDELTEKSLKQILNEEGKTLEDLSVISAPIFRNPWILN